MLACTISALVALTWLQTTPQTPPLRAVQRPSRTSTISALGLTGSTLEATLKMQCDVAGSGYAIFWADVGGSLVVAGDYTTDARRAATLASGLTKTFAEESESYSLPVDGDGPVSEVYRTGKPILVKDAGNSNLLRRDLAKKYDLAEIAFIQEGELRSNTSMALHGLAPLWRSSTMLRTACAHCWREQLAHAPWRWGRLHATAGARGVPRACAVLRP
jgi:hypothetical protein